LENALQPDAGGKVDASAGTAAVVSTSGEGAHAGNAQGCASARGPADAGSPMRALMTAFVVLAAIRRTRGAAHR
jgi:hypothetical protein